MSLPPEMLQWMKDSHTATQEQIKQQAEEAKAAEQRSREALLAIEKRAEAAAEDQKAAEQRHQEALRAMEEKANKAEAAAKAEREALQQALQDSHTEFQKALENVAKQGHASTAAAIAGMQTPGDGTAFKDLVKLCPATSHSSCSACTQNVTHAGQLEACNPLEEASYCKLSRHSRMAVSPACE